MRQAELEKRAVERVRPARSELNLLAFGAVLGSYEILDPVGSGGIGVVYKARHLLMDRLVALKFLRPSLAQDPQFRLRFLQEMQSVARLDHPHIVRGYDAGELAGTLFCSMEFVDGPSLDQKLTETGRLLREREALRIALQVARALEHAHGQEVLHRDVKPDNVLLDAKGSAKLADFGLAGTWMKCAPGAEQEHTEYTVGTPFYIAPEQACGVARLTPAADLYSLGVVFFQMLTGRIPYDGVESQAIMRQHVTAPVPDPRKQNSKVSPKAALVCQKLMQKEPEARYRSARALATDIERLLAGEDLLFARPSSEGHGAKRDGGSSSSTRPAVGSSRKLLPAARTPAATNPEAKPGHKRRRFEADAASPAAKPQAALGQLLGSVKELFGAKPAPSPSERPMRKRKRGLEGPQPRGG
ncbi:MAG: hypothetical protein AMXMBFR7_43870 [Planctomycetota bacterium]